MDGSTVKVEPWGFELRGAVLPILAELVHEIMTAGATVGDHDIVTFLLRFSTHVDDLVQLTMDWDDAELKKRCARLEDHMKLSRVVMSVCVIREDGGGPLGELLRLYATGTQTLKTARTTATSRAVPLLPTSSTARSARSSGGVTVLPKSGD